MLVFNHKFVKILFSLITISILLAVTVWAIWIPSATAPGYVFVAAWGEKGSAAGQFDDPTGIAVTDDEVFVSDARNARIQVLDRLCDEATHQGQRHGCGRSNNLRRKVHHQRCSDS